MKMKQYNKTTATVIAGAIMAVLTSFVVMDINTMTAVQTFVTMALVWAIPNA